MAGPAAAARVSVWPAGTLDRTVMKPGRTDTDLGSTALEGQDVVLSTHAGSAVAVESL
jgi:hypothetical protein